MNNTIPVRVTSDLDPCWPSTGRLPEQEEHLLLRDVLRPVSELFIREEKQFYIFRGIDKLVARQSSCIPHKTNQT